MWQTRVSSDEVRALENIRIGLDVYCGDDHVGSVAKLVADSNDSHVSDLVVDRGLLHGAKLIPLGQVQDVRDGNVLLAIGREQFQAADGFVDQRFRSPDDNWSAPPGYDRADFLLDAEVAYGAAGGYGTTGKPSPFPPSPADPRPRNLRPIVQEGTAVVAVDGPKVGEIATVSFDPADGRLTSVELKWGLLGHERAELPLEWIDDLGADGLGLNVPAEQIKQWQERR